MAVDELTTEQLAEQQAALTARVNDVLQSIEGSSEPTEVKNALTEIQQMRVELAPLQFEQQRRQTEEVAKTFGDTVETLTKGFAESLTSMREGARLPSFEASQQEESLRYGEGKVSLFGDISKSRSGGKASNEAAERLNEFYGTKANEYIEGTDSRGGYLVRPEFLGQLPPRTRPSTLVDLIPSVNVRSDQIEFVRWAASETAGWSDELATKVQAAQQTFSNFTASVFTVAAYALSSNQLLEDSSVDALIRDQLERGIRKVIETAVLNGSGTGQPLGILQTPGTTYRPYTDASPTVAELLPVIALAITDVMDNHLSSPTHIIMRPQTWTKIITDPASGGTFTFGAGVNDPGQRTAIDPFPGRTLYGLPVVLSANVPADRADGAQAAGAGTQTRVIVTDISEQLFLNRSDLQVDLSEHVFFLSNQTVFRGERRVGFTAGRYPTSTAVIGGTGLDAGTF